MVLSQLKNSSSIRSAVVFIFFILSILILAGQTQAQTSCGDTITGSTILSGDMDCTGVTGNIFTFGANDIVFDCNNHSVITDVASNVFMVGYSANVEIKNCNIIGSGSGNGISVGPASYVHDNSLYDFSNGIYLVTSDSVVTGNEFHGMNNGVYSYAHYLRPGIISNNIFSNNLFQDIANWVITQDSVSANSFTFTPDNQFINVNNGIFLSGSNNIIEGFVFDVATTGIMVGGPGSIVRNNVINGTGVGSAVYIGTGNQVYNNYCSNFANGVYLNGSDNVVIGNEFHGMNNGVYSYAHYLRPGVISNNTFSNNLFQDIANWVITQDSVTANSFTFTSDNRLINVNNGIYLSGSNNIIEGFVFDVATTGILVGGPGNIVRNNVINGSGAGSAVYIGVGNEVYNNYCSNFANGVYLNGSDNVVTGNEFHGMYNGVYSYAHYLRPGVISNNTFSNNLFQDIANWVITQDSVSANSFTFTSDNRLINVNNGIYLSGSNNIIEGFVFDVAATGIMVGGPGNIVRNNVINGTGAGSAVYIGTGNEVYNNYCSNFTHGVNLNGSDNVVTGNEFHGMYNGVYSYAHYLRPGIISNNTFSSNLFQDIANWVITQDSVSANSFTFTSDNRLINVNNGIFLSGSNNIIEGFVLDVAATGIMVGGPGNIVRNNVINGTGAGSAVYIGTGNGVYNNYCSNFTHGVNLNGSDNVVTGNEFHGMYNGVYSYAHYLRPGIISNNTFSNNLFQDIANWVITQDSVTANSFTFTSDNQFINVNNGIFLSGSNNNLEGITLNVTGSGITVGGPGGTLRDNVINGAGTGSGMYVFGNDHTIENNTVDNFQKGIYLQYSSNNTISGNTVSNSGNGIFIATLCNGNVIFNNNFIDNITQASVYQGNTDNIFNLDLPQGGNYWSDYDTPEEGCFDLDSNYFCDAPYYFSLAEDNLPSNRQFGENFSPMADAGNDQTIHAGSVVTLDGSGSSDPDGHLPLTYEWSFIAVPEGSTAMLSDPATVNPTFTVDIMGDYLLQLIVTDNLGASSAPDTVTFSTLNSPPLADAGQDISATLLGTLIQLDGTQSYDLDGDDITHQWTFFSIPVGSSASLAGADTATPTFAADVYGNYVIQLVVSDSWDQSLPDYVTVSFENLKPVADAGASQSAVVGDIVFFDGSGSWDPNNDLLTYKWELLSGPEGNISDIVDPTEKTASIVPYVPGTYVVQLVVNDGLIDSDPDTIQIEVVLLQTMAVEAIQNLETVISQLDPGEFKNRNMQNTLINKLNAVIANIESGNYEDAVGQLRNDVSGKTNGCIFLESPDKNDWIMDCAAQEVIYLDLANIINMIEGLL